MYLSSGSSVKDLVVHPAKGFVRGKLECHIWHILHERWQIARKEAPYAWNQKNFQISAS